MEEVFEGFAVEFEDVGEDVVGFVEDFVGVVTG